VAFAAEHRTLTEHFIPRKVLLDQFTQALSVTDQESIDSR